MISKSPSRVATTSSRILAFAFSGSRTNTQRASSPLRRQFFTRLDASSTDPTLASRQKLATTSIDGYEHLFDVQLVEGRCVGVRIGQLLAEESSISKHQQHNSDDSVVAAISNTTQFASWIHESLHPDEVHYASKLKSATSQKSFIGGRLALRHAMECQIYDCIILKDAYGRPTLPPTFLGSISHKGDVAVALVAMTNTADGEPHHDWAIGVDLEVRQKGHARIAQRILTQHERNSLGSLNDENVNADQEVLLRFSVKEALYKAMHPLICQYVGFQEAETQPLANGTVQVALNLTSQAHHGFDSVSAHWRTIGGDEYFLTSAKIRLKPGVKAKGNDQNPEECRM